MLVAKRNPRRRLNTRNDLVRVPTMTKSHSKSTRHVQCPVTKHNAECARLGMGIRLRVSHLFRKVLDRQNGLKVKNGHALGLDERRCLVQLLVQNVEI